MKKECEHYKRISEEADKQIALLKDEKSNETHSDNVNCRVTSDVKAQTCDGCIYKIDFPSSVHCFGCSRMYSDHYVADSNINTDSQK